MCQFPEVLEVQRYLNRTEPRLPRRPCSLVKLIVQAQSVKGPAPCVRPAAPRGPLGSLPTSFSVGSFKDSFITFFFFEKYVTFKKLFCLMLFNHSMEIFFFWFMFKMQLGIFVMDQHWTFQSKIIISLHFCSLIISHCSCLSLLSGIDGVGWV